MTTLIIVVPLARSAGKPAPSIDYDAPDYRARRGYEEA